MSMIIKARSSVPQSSGTQIASVAFNFEDVAGQAGQYLDEVRKQAAGILREAQKEAETIRREAEHQGHQAALQAVDRVMNEKVGKQMETLLPALQKAAEEIEHSRQAWMQCWHTRAVHLACCIAERVIRRQIAQTPHITLDLVSEALQLASGSAEITLRLNPADFDTLSGQIDRITAQLKQVAPARVVADPDITVGGCRVDTRFGSIDQQIQSQLERIEEELAGAPTDETT